MTRIGMGADKAKGAITAAGARGGFMARRKKNMRRVTLDEHGRRKSRQCRRVMEDNTIIFRDRGINLREKKRIWNR